MFKDGKIIFGSRNRQLTSNEGDETTVQKQFRITLEYIKDKIKDIDLNKFEGYIYFGEAMTKHTMSYDWNKIPRFLGFDIYDMKKDIFINNPEKIFKKLNLDFVHILFIKTAKECREWKLCDSEIPITKYPPLSNPNLKSEGIVFKNYKKQIFGKYVREQFKEENAEAFGGTPKYEETDDGKITARFCTNARIEKFIFKFIDEGDKLELAMMKRLPNIVSNDIWEENWREIVKKYQEIKPRQIRKIVTKRCLSVLKQVITNNILENKEKL